MSESEAIPATPTGDDRRWRNAAARSMWALGDYHRFARQTVWELGPLLVDACGVAPGQSVLDVAAGTGNVAIRAAEKGALVTASDLTPENFAAGRREAAARGVELEWREADAEDLPFADASFDVVTSSMGAIFAPDHRRVAHEMLRVCRPGGVLGMINFTPEGLAADFFGTLMPYAPPPPPGALSPLLWGSEEHVRDLLGERVCSLEMTRRHYVERSAGGPGGYRELCEQTFGPLIAIRNGLAAEPARLAALDRDFADFTVRADSGPPGGPAEYRYEVLLVVARKR
jgi:SAM-dependent methyltransferase